MLMTMCYLAEGRPGCWWVSEGSSQCANQVARRVAQHLICNVRVVEHWFLHTGAGGTAAILLGGLLAFRRVRQTCFAVLSILCMAQLI